LKLDKEIELSVNSLKREFHATELSDRNCGSQIFLYVHAGLVVGQKWKIEGRHARVKLRQAFVGIWEPKNVGSELSGGII